MMIIYVRNYQRSEAIERIMQILKKKSLSENFRKGF